MHTNKPQTSTHAHFHITITDAYICTQRIYGYTHTCTSTHMRPNPPADAYLITHSCEYNYTHINIVTQKILIHTGG